MNHLPAALKTYLAWKFDAVIPGSFRRNKAAFAHHEYPILGPLPAEGRKTSVLQRSSNVGPFVYFVCDDQDQVRYIGKTLELGVLQRWIRPGVGGPATQYWTHSTASGGCVFSIASELLSKASAHFTLRYVPVGDIDVAMRTSVGVKGEGSDAAMASLLEKAFIKALRPDWNVSS